MPVPFFPNGVLLEIRRAGDGLVIVVERDVLEADALLVRGKRAQRFRADGDRALDRLVLAPVEKFEARRQVLGGESTVRDGEGNQASVDAVGFGHERDDARSPAERLNGGSDQNREVAEAKRKTALRSA